MSLELDQFYQKMQHEQEMHFFTSVNDVVSAFEYHGVELMLDTVFENHPNFRNEVIQYLNKQQVLT